MFLIGLVSNFDFMAEKAPSVEMEAKMPAPMPEEMEWKKRLFSSKASQGLFKLEQVEKIALRLKQPNVVDLDDKSRKACELFLADASRLAPKLAERVENARKLLQKEIAPVKKEESPSTLRQLHDRLVAALSNYVE